MYGGGGGGGGWGRGRETGTGRERVHERTGPSCSKLTTSLVNDSLKFTSSNTQIF